jgi:homoserine dehydrogenase
MELRLWRIGFVGFGNVGRTLARLLLDSREELRARHGITFAVTLVAGARRGAWVEPDGLDLERAIAGGWSSRLEALDAIRTAPLDLIFELTPLEPRTGEPAASHIRAALDRGVAAVSANKGPIAWSGRALHGLARRRECGFRFESAVADCLPIFNLVEGAFPVGRVLSFRGVLNSTSNFVLQAVARGEPAEAAVAEMQRLGFAEADPSHDLDGWDQAVKATIMANVLLGGDRKPTGVKRVPLSHVDVEWLRAERRAGRVVRLAAHGDRGGEVGVGPISLEPGEFLASLQGTALGLTLQIDPAGTVNVSNVDPGLMQTAYGCLADFVAIHQGRLTLPDFG